MKNKYNTSKYVLLSYLNLFVRLITGFMILPFVVASLGQSNFGLMRLVYSLTGYMGVLDFGLGRAVTRYTSLYNSKEKKEKINTLVSFSILIYILLAFIGLFIGIVVFTNFGDWFNLSIGEVSEGKLAFLIALSNILLNLPFLTFSAVIKGYNKYDIYYTTTILKNIFRVLLMFVFLNLGFGLITIFIIDLCVNQSLNIFRFLYSVKVFKIKFSLNNFDENFKRSFSKYSFFVFLGVITDLIYWKTDNILLGIFSNTKNIAVYSISQDIVRYYRVLVATFASVFLPKLTNLSLTETDKSYSKLKKFFVKSSRYQFVIVLAIIVNYIFIGKDFITLWVGENYLMAYSYSLIIMLPMIIPLLQSAGPQILYAINKHKIRSIVYLLIAIINIFLSIFLIKMYGVVGAAIGTSFAMTFGNVIFMNVYYKKLLDLKLIRFFKKICLKPIILIIPSISLFLLMNCYFEEVNVLIFIIKIFVSNIIFVILMYKYFLNKQEKKQIKKLLNIRG